MGKRTSSPVGERPAAKSAVAPAQTERAVAEQDDMGEFEDQWEDEFEDDEEAGEVVDAAENEDGEDGEMEVDEQEQRPASPKPYLPGTKLEEGEFLAPDLSTYPLLHSFVPTWPSLSFDILRDNDGEERRGYPVSCALVAGTQAGDPTANEVTVMRWEGLGKTRRDPEESDGEDSDDDDTEDDPVLTFRAIPHKGGVNRIRARPLGNPLSQGPPLPPDPYHVATFSETGKVHIFDIAPHLNSLLSPATASASLSKNPLHTVDNHGRAEGFALDWSKPSGSSTSHRLLSGDIYSKIYLTTLSPSSITTSPKPFSSHTDSVEDIQWSPQEATVFASCSADRSIRVWDIRMKERKSAIGVAGAHSSDVNVISWNLSTQYLLASGGDEGGIKVWDLRNFKGTSAPAPTPVVHFSWHTAPITSIEWHPTDESCLAAAGADDQVTLWDLSVEEDEDERPTGPDADRLRDVPAQLLFCHQGQSDVKEVHWHPQIPGTVVSTAADGFNIFKSLPFSS
ncbi:Ribosome assembly protein rrb1 [Rhodotorula toruloides]